ncbi:hypothetical protein AB0I84_21020 [Streptomyces spectabilis]|uniref:hypothetical protein n=1 Tax=Streptomyces spectabilis TaxID=68270 RepID=UPI0033E9FAF7
MGVIDREWIPALQCDGRYARLLQLLECKAWQQRLVLRGFVHEKEDQAHTP